MAYLGSPALDNSDFTLFPVDLPFPSRLNVFQACLCSALRHAHGRLDLLGLILGSKKNAAWPTVQDGSLKPETRQPGFKKVVKVAAH